jgi:hypothetical protein
MSDGDPFTLLLPLWLAKRFDLARVIKRELRGSWSEGYRLLERFDMSGPERVLVKTVLERRTNLWLFRANQRLACGDFLAVDMSPAGVADRRVHVIELKTGEPLVLGGARAQCARHREAVEELVARGILAAESRVELVYGDSAAVLGHLGIAP